MLFGKKFMVFIAAAAGSAIYDSAKPSALNFPIDGAANTFHGSSMFDY